MTMEVKKLKLMTIVGTRPEIIKMSAIIKKADLYFNQILVHTGQNYDYELNKVFFEDLGLREPDYYLGVVGEPRTLSAYCPRSPSSRRSRPSTTSSPDSPPSWQEPSAA